MAPLLSPGNDIGAKTKDDIKFQNQSSRHGNIQRRGFSHLAARSEMISELDSRREDDTTEDESFSGDFDEEYSILGHESDGDEDNDVVFKSRPTFPESSMHQIPIGKLVEMLEQGMIDVAPQYQRDAVWSDDRMIGLINSVMDNYYIPPLVFGTVARSEEKLVCIDGKQRLTSIKKFVDGLIPCTDAHKSKWYFKEPQTTDKKRRLKLLTVQVQKTFLCKTLTYCKFAGLSRAQQEDLFRRVQLGLPLSLAERLRAQTGPWQGLAKQFEKNFEEILNLSGNHRGKGFQTLLLSFAQVIETENKTPGSSSAIQSGSARLQKFIKDVDALTPSRRSKLRKIFTTFKEIAAQDVTIFRNNGYERSKNFTTVELIAVAVLISTCGEHMTNDGLLRAIRDMRGHVRQRCHDLFANDTTWRVLWRFIQTVQVSSGALSGVKPEPMDDKKIIVLSDDDDKIIVLSDDDFQNGKLGPRSSPSLRRTSEMDHQNPLKQQRKSLIVKLPLKRKVRSRRPAGETVPRQRISSKVSGTTNSNACKASGDDKEDFPDDSTASSGYSTHSEVLRRPAVQKRRTRIPSSSGESTMRNSPSPNPVPTAGAGTVNGLRAGAPVSRGLRVEDADSTVIKHEPIIFGAVSNSARELAESWPRVKEEHEKEDAQNI